MVALWLNVLLRMSKLDVADAGPDQNHHWLCAPSIISRASASASFLGFPWAANCSASAFTIYDSLSISLSVSLRGVNLLLAVAVIYSDMPLTSERLAG